MNLKISKTKKKAGDDSLGPRPGWIPRGDPRRLEALQEFADALLRAWRRKKKTRSRGGETWRG
jgi:hypothetical protein